MVTINEEVEIFSKLIVDRINENAKICAIPHSKRSWTDVDRRIIKRLVLDIKGIILTSDTQFTILTKWIEVLSFPDHVESFLVSKTVQLYEKKNFLKLREAMWLMEIIPTIV